MSPTLPKLSPSVAAPSRSRPRSSPMRGLTGKGCGTSGTHNSLSGRAGPGLSSEDAATRAYHRAGDRERVPSRDDHRLSAHAVAPREGPAVVLVRHAGEVQIDQRGTDREGDDRDGETPPR